ncbi:BcPKS16, polyketide synthase [Lindgomyces ingoldianus]|uniref:BcPKS16, polyketide synthase n=1 Tax=Lindgomyces ingoldianus TaxID=673940 RepID=A0ACB6QD29_9PLEO|nr:BcPKS16, polyketide synthase [Lindgomyces ingoldianus]KAF2464017.1 BcPKS16, polyketide synthase [Lindgomyces ingoldianus]
MAVSLTIFGPQSCAPSETYLDSVRSFILGHPILGCISQNIHALNDVWSLLANENPDIAALSNGQRYTNILTQWLTDGYSELAASTSSGIVALPRLAIIQFTQYFQFLDNQGITHAELVSQVRDLGGIQGYCGGLPAAVALACARSEQELAQSICIAIRLAFAIGLYAELGDDSDIPGITTAVVRLKREGQAEELVRMFPHTYISAINDPKSVSVVGPIKQLAELQAYATRQGLLVRGMGIRGKTHNPENKSLAAELSALCEASDLLRLPEPSLLQAAVRSNRTGAILNEGPWTKEIVETILASKCEWYELLCNIASDLKKTGIEEHRIVSFGIGDCVSLMPFNKLGLQMTKTDWSGQNKEAPKTPVGRLLNGHSYLFPENAVAVIGASARLPGARNMHELWELLSKGEDRHEELGSDRFDLYGGFRASQSGSFTKNRKFYGNFVDGVDRFDNAFFGINAREMLNMDPQQRMLLELSYEAMECSGYTRFHVRSRGDPVGCFIGASFVEYLDNTNAHPPTAYTSTGTIRAFLCGRLSYYFGWSGPAEVIDTACSSSLVAINRAVKSIQAGECSMALTGGVNLMTGVNNFLDLAKAGFLSPTGQCKPFDKNADGYCRAEGAGLVVLKPLKQAELDGDRIMGVIVGAATNQGGLSNGLTVPSSDAQIKLYQSVLEQANMSPDQVTYVEAHGTGTQAGDPLEIASVRSVFGSPKRTTEVQIGSIKGNIGHCETAAGVAGLLKTICMLEHQAIPPQASHKVWNPKIPALSQDRMAISTSLREWDAPIRAALVNSYGAAGSNAALICCEGPKPSQTLQHESPMQVGAKWPIILSAQSESSLKRYKDSLVDYLTKATPQPPISDVAATLDEKRRRHKLYVVFEASNTRELIEHLTVDGSQKPPLERGTPCPVVLTFGGQSKQTVGLDKSFYEYFITFRTTLNMCDDILQELGYLPILPAVFDTTNIPDIVVLQTGFVAVQYAAATTWISAGLKVDAVIGHSLGELTALAVSGKLSIRDCLKLVAARANLMKTKWGHDKGSMLAVFSSRDVVADILAGSKLEVACYNSDKSQVVTGERGAIADLERRLSSKSPPVKCLKVDTSHGFHSHLVDPILDDLAQVAASLEWKEPAIPIEFCTERPADTNSPYSPSDHARNAVFLVEAMRRLEQTLGRCVFLEAGMNTAIMSMAKRAVAQPDIHSFIALSTKDAEDPANVISRTVCSLWCSSVEVTHWPLVQPDCNTNYVWLPPYQFDPTSAWLDNVDRAAVLQSQLNQRVEPEVNQARPMVTLLPELENSRNNAERFRVSVEGHRFRGIVAGHAVRNRPLCPASVYLECVTMALSIVAGDLKDSYLDFQGLDIQAPLGIGAEIVEVVLEKASTHSCWGFKVVSRDRKETLHARGRVTKSSESKLETIARLLGKRMDSLADNADAERMLSRRAYSLFSRVVTYATFLEGISSITMSGAEAVAKIVTPPGQPGVDESTAVHICDSVTLDNFIQIVGLLMNTSDMIGNGEVMVCTGVDSSMIAKGVNMVDCRSWKVHASYTPSGPSQAIGDVFAFSEDDSVVAAFTGCRFAKLEITRLERLLDPVNQVAGSKPPEPKVQHHSVPPPPPAQLDINPGMTPDISSSPSSDGKPSSPPIENTLRQTLETYTGVAAVSILDDTILGDLGLDSLAATEMAEELQSSNQISIDSQELVYMSVKQLEQKIYGSSAGKVVPTLIAQVSTNGVNGAMTSTHLNGAGDIDKVGSVLGPKLSELLVEVTGVTISAIKPQMTLDSLGVDSLALTEIVSALSELCSSPPNTDDISPQSTINDILQTLGAMGDHSSTDSSDGGATGSADSEETSFSSPSSKMENNEACMRTDPATGLLRCEAEFERAAASRGFQNYWAEVAMKQDALTLAYIFEAFQKLGINFASMKEGDRVPQIKYLPKHRHLFQRLRGILMKHDIIKQEDGNIMTRGNKTASTKLSSQLHEEFIHQYPKYAIEARLMNLTGPKLAECLTGDVDPIRLLFGSPSASKILEEYYGRSPMLSTMTSQLVTLITSSLGVPEPKTTLRILEIGAGTGGTTAELAARLTDIGVRVEYTFTDVSSSMVAKAKIKFAQYGWMSFERLDLEQPMPAHLQGKFDIIIGTNCVHATKDKVATTRRIRTMLNSDGFVVLSEVTRIIDWYDLVFGLLEGWWLADGGSSYPLQPPEVWMKAFQDVGFASTMYSRGSSEDANTQHLLIGSNRVVNGYPASAPVAPALEKMTVVYKEVDGVQIEADVFCPASAPTQPMAIALMLHGGGHMTLSKRAIRPAQTAHLLSNGVLPISLDYRLCPEINVIDGAMADVRDGFVWARCMLPSIVASRGIMLDTERIVVIGWSTGGHLAMSTAWTVGEAGGTPPKAVLSFYAPTDFLSKDVFPRRSTARIPHRMSRDQILQIDVSGTPITNYDMQGVEDPELGWVKWGDARSELLLSLFRESREYGLSLMLNGEPGTRKTVQELLSEPPTWEKQASMCPTAQLRAGEYKVPTFIIHGEADDIALFESASELHQEMKRQGIKSGFVAVKNGSHIHDLRLKPGMAKWEEQVAPGYQFLFDSLKD